MKLTARRYPLKMDGWVRPSFPNFGFRTWFSGSILRFSGVFVFLKKKNIPRQPSRLNHQDFRIKKQHIINWIYPPPPHRMPVANQFVAQDSLLKKQKKTTYTSPKKLIWNLKIGFFPPWKRRFLLEFPSKKTDPMFSVLGVYNSGGSLKD